MLWLLKVLCQKVVALMIQPVDLLCGLLFGAVFKAGFTQCCFEVWVQAFYCQLASALSEIPYGLSDLPSYPQTADYRLGLCVGFFLLACVPFVLLIGRSFEVRRTGSCRRIGRESGQA